MAYVGMSFFPGMMSIIAYNYSRVQVPVRLQSRLLVIIDEPTCCHAATNSTPVSNYQHIEDASAISKAQAMNFSSTVQALFHLSYLCVESKTIQCISTSLGHQSLPRDSYRILAQKM